MPELIDILAAARRLGVGRTTIIYLIERGDLEEFRVPSARGKRLDRYVRKDQVEALATGGWRRREPRPRRKGGEAREKTTGT